LRRNNIEVERPIPLRIAYYGDDFTGSTDVMESLARGGVRTVLTVDAPTPEVLARHPHATAIGIAGQARMMSPAEMDQSLPAAFAALGALAPKFVHYKVCSTFDSSPAIGSIGRAIDIGARAFGNRITPLLVGAPSLQRFCAFGNLFARSGLDSIPFRLDRHPTMSRHPVTPMDEADLRLHLARQTNRPIELVDVLTLDDSPTALFNRLAACPDGSIVLFDAMTNSHLATIGAALVELQRREAKPLFVAGSSGIEAALTNRWLTLGNTLPAELPLLAPVDRILAVSGSCSPVTDRQIGWALAHGFAEIPLDGAALRAASLPDSEVEAIANRIQSEHDRGQSVIVHTSRGPVDASSGAAPVAAGSSASFLGDALGRIVRAALRKTSVRRVAVAGGDTAGQVARTLGIKTLEMVATSAPGAPLCRAHATAPEVDRVEFTFKGGQVGHDNYFGAVRGDH
jgi:uncharacterized protein YgbK (DUF1537 family)